MQKPKSSEKFDALATYDEGAYDYDEASSRYWTFYGEQTINLLDLQPGFHILDAACGPGHAATLASQKVGRRGHVVGIDMSPRMITLSRRKADELGLGNMELLVSDMSKLDLQAEQFDAVMCNLGIFFVDDMVQTLSDLWNLVRVGGRLGIATVGPRFFEPMYQRWLSSARDVQPDLYISPPWERTNDPEVVKRLLLDAGVNNPRISTETRRLILESHDEWWRIVMGTGLRKYVEEMGAVNATRVRDDNLTWAKVNDINTLELSAIYAVAEKTN
jgi:ubiquinone/menaquinone biosynthesis C-methylase UbiE